MFRVESYITPLITSYLDKYVKLKKEDFQLSLWGGDAVLQKLDLRLDAIERAINIPITFKSGHIHELRLHVPWTKLGSEPVVITINTIECVLKLRDFAYTQESLAPAAKQKIRQKPPSEDLPPGYLQSMLNRIVNNMQIVVNNLILKFVEDDIVMSVNIKSAESFSVDRLWEQSFVDIDPTELILRKVINFNDLTICLDKRDASGKIETYQDPTVYRCVFTCRMYMQYDSLHAKFPNVTKFNLLCEKLDVSLTDLQLPMFFRLLELCIALYYGSLELPIPDKEVTLSYQQDDDSAIEMRTEGESHGQGESWAGWAWSYVPQVLPVDEDLAEDEDEEAEKTKPPDPILAVGFYCNHITITLKQTEIVQENRYYGPQKIVFKSFACVDLHGIAMECLMQGITFFNARFGIASSKIYGSGNCPCGISPAQCAPKTSVFFQSGPQDVSRSDRAFCQASLFDPSGPENQGGRYHYVTERDDHLQVYNETYALQKFSSFWFDYLYTMDGTEEESPGCSVASSMDLDHMREVSTMSAIFGPCHLAVTSVMIHCLNKFLYAAYDHEYEAYSKPVKETKDETPQPAATPDQLKALEHFVSSRTYKLTLVSPTLTLVANEHASCEMSTRKVVNTAKRQKRASRPGSDQPHPVVPVPALLVQASRLDIQHTMPMYPRRIVRWISKLENPSGEFMHICHSHINAKLFGLQTSLYRLDNPKIAAIPFIMPVSAAMYKKTLLLPCFWEDRPLSLREYMYEISYVSARLSMPVCLLASHIVCSWLLHEPCPQRLLMTSLVDDVFNKKESERHLSLECRLSGAELRQCKSRTTSSVSASVNSVQAAVTKTVSGVQTSIVLLQGPQTTPTLYDHAHFTKPREHVAGPAPSLVELTWQLCQSGEDLKVPSVLLVSVSGMVLCADPALYRWLSYTNQSRSHPMAAKLLQSRSQAQDEPRTSPRGSQPTDSNAPTDPARSHSRLLDVESHSTTATPGERTEKQTMADYVADHIPVIKRTEVQIDVAQTCVIFPTHSQTCSSNTILERVRSTLAPLAAGDGTNESRTGYLVCCVPSVQLYSHHHKPIDVQQDLPVQDPHLINSVEKLPWTLKMKNGSIYTLSAGETCGRSILKPAALNSTLAVTRKFTGRYQDELKAVGLCVHADMGSLSVALSQIQVELVLNLLGQALNAGQYVMRSASTMRQCALPPPKPLPHAAEKRGGQTVTSKTSTRRDSNSEIAGVSVSQPEEPVKKLPTLAENPPQTVDSADVQLSLWLQWTLPKLLIRLYHQDREQGGMCVSTSLEDLTTSVDVQDVYCKVKSKIGALNVNHYVQRCNQWRLGDHGGLLLSTSDKLTRNIAILSQSWSSSQPLPRTTDYKPRDAAHAFLSFTYTRALSKNYSKKTKDESGALKNKYLHEICLTTQPLDVVLALPVLMNIKDIFDVHWPKTDIKKDVTDITIMTSSLAASMTSSNAKTVVAATTSSSLPWLTSSLLPLLYVNLSCSRLFVPLTSSKSRDGEVGSVLAEDESRDHDVYLLEMASLVVTPQPDNPLPRVLVERDEVEKMVEQCPLSAKPGSRLEDRQYQLDLTGLGLCTGSWRELMKAGSWREGNLKDEEIVGTQNPALEWNNLLTSSSTGDVNFIPLVAGLDLRVVVAPPVVHPGDQEIGPQVVAGYNAEVNAVSDINFTVSTNQIQLLHQISAHYLRIVQSATGASKNEPIVVHEESFDISRATTPEVDDFCLIEEETDSQTQVSDGFIVVPHKTEIDKSGVHISTGTASSLSTVSIATTPVAPTFDEMTPVDVLLTAGKISCLLYTCMTSSNPKEPEATSKRKCKSDLEWKQDYPLSLPAEFSGLDVSGSGRKMRTMPILFCQFAQPHSIVKLSSGQQMVELSCYNFSLKGPRDNTTDDGRGESCDLVDWVETKPGEPDPKTGVPPSLYTLRAQNFLLNAAVISVLLERPVQVCVNLNRLRHLLDSVRTLSAPLVTADEPVSSTSSPEQTVVSEDRSSVHSLAKLKQYLSYVTLAHFKTVQMVVRLEAGSSDAQADVVMDLSSVSGELEHRTNQNGSAEELASFMLEDWRLLTSYKNKRRPFVGPLNGSLRASAVWGAHSGGPRWPRLGVNVDAGAVEVFVGQEHYLSARTVLEQITNFMPSSSPTPRSTRSGSSKRDKLRPHFTQTRKSEDDLRSGRFTYIFDDVDGVELPLPYEIHFTDRDAQARSTMTWTYADPVCLVKVTITPVPFNVTVDDTSFVIPCTLQYWDLGTCQWMNYVTFFLSENEHCDLELPSTEGADKMAAASTWRIEMETMFDDSTSEDDVMEPEPLILPASLAASVRVDSAVLPALIPAIQASCKVALVQVRLANHVQHLGKATASRYHPFFSSGTCHKDQEYALLNVDNLQLGLRHIHRQQTFLSGRVLLQCDVTEFRQLTVHPLFTPTLLKLHSRLVYKHKQPVQVECSVEMSPVFVYMRQSYVHTLNTAVQAWSQMEEPEKNRVMPAEYVICNDTSVNVKFGQVQTDECVTLECREMVPYSWRSQKQSKRVRVGVEGHEWRWSEPFSLDETGTVIRTLVNERAQKIVLVIRIKPRGTAVTQVIIRGQLIVASRLDEHLEVKVITHGNETRSSILAARQTMASYVIPEGEMRALKVKVVGTKGLWTQEIPLSGDKMKEIRMVKIPSGDRNQPVYAWCQIFCDHCTSHSQNLVVLMPVFIVRSHLPTSLLMNVVTPKVNSSRQVKVKGQGQDQQLLTLPGDLVHSVTLQTSTESKASSPPVFLSVGLLEQTSNSVQPRKKFDLEALCHDWENDTETRKQGYVPRPVHRPFPRTESAVKTRPMPPEVTVVEQEYDHQDINLQIRFEQHWPDCNTLLMEIYPPVLVINRTPFNLVLSEADRMWTVKKGSTWATQLFTEPVRLGMAVYGRMVFSSLIEFSTDDKTTSAYLPPVEGRLYKNGSAHACLKYQEQATGEAKVCWFVLQSRTSGGIQKIIVRERFTFINETHQPLWMRLITLPNDGKVQLRELEVTSTALATPPPSGGQPTYLWSLAGHVTDDVITGNSLATFVCFSQLADGVDTSWSDEALLWSQPVRVKSANEACRRTFSAATAGELYSTRGYVLVCQEEEGVTYCTLYRDTVPRTVVHNRTSLPVYCGQTRLDLSIRDPGVEEQASPLVAIPQIPANQSAHYTFPYQMEKFPQLDTRTIPGLHLSTGTPETLQWSSQMEITTKHDSIVDIPNGIDVRVHVERVCHTDHIYVDRVNRAEISTREKRDQNVGQETVVVMGTQTKTSVEECQRSNLLLQGLENEQRTNVSLTSSFIMVLPTEQRAASTESAPTPVKVKVIVHGHFQQACFILLTDRVTETATEVLRVCVDNGFLAVRPSGHSAHAQSYGIGVALGCVQVDNQLHVTGKYDFRVLYMPRETTAFLEDDLDDFLGSVCAVAMENLFSRTFLKLNFNVEHDLREGRVALTTVDIDCEPFLAFVEDQFVYDLLHLMTSFVPDSDSDPPSESVPKSVTCTASSLRGPIMLEHLLIRPISACLSIHASAKMFIGLDNSPLHLGKLEKNDVMTTVSHLTRVVTMHYVSAAIFRAGWVVGSLELLGNPAGLVRNLGSGVLDLFRLPIQGLTRGPGSFLSGMVGGVSSLLWHVSTGTLSSITNFASSVSRNMDRLSLDADHWQRQEESRRQTLDGMGHGFRQGLTGFGISLLGAVAGIADQPLQSLQHHGDSERAQTVTQTAAGFLSGVGKGLIGVVTKPVGGAAELVSQTGKGLLHTAGLTSHHQGRYEPFIVRMERAKNAPVKFLWKLLPNISSSDVLYIVDCKEICEREPVADIHLVLTSTAVFLVKLSDPPGQWLYSRRQVEEDCAVQALLLSEIECQAPANHPTIILIYLYNHSTTTTTAMSLEEKSDRIAEYLSTSSTDPHEMTSRPDDDVTSVSESESVPSTQSRHEFHCSPRQRACFIRHYNLVVRRTRGQGFPII